MIRATLIISLALSRVVVGQDAKEEVLSPAQARTLIQEWVKTERLVTEEMEAWEIEREQLNDLMKLYETEISLLKAEVDKAGSSHVELDKEKTKLEDEVKQMREQRRALAEQVVKLSARMVKLSERFPKPLQDQLAADLSTLELVESQEEMRDGVVALLNVLKEAGRFNRLVTYSEELQTLDGGSERQLEVIYLGLGRAYFVSGDKAGVGVPTPESWKWSEREGIEKQVRNLIRIYKKTAQQDLVKLPVEVKP